MDIYSTNPYPSGDLSNLAHHKFMFDGIECESMEGLLQSFKIKDKGIQLQACKLWGKEAKNFCKNVDWYSNQTLYWGGVEFKRDSNEYQSLLNRAYLSLALNEDFRKALLETGYEQLTHSIGKKDVTKTILTEEEFCSRLMTVRLLIREGKI